MSAMLFVGATYSQPLKRLSILASFCQNHTTYKCILHYCNPGTATASAFAIMRSTTSGCRYPPPPLLARAGGLPSCRIEGPDCKLAPRQRTSFVAIHGCKLPRHVGKDRREFLWPLRLC